MNKSSFNNFLSDGKIADVGSKTIVEVFAGSRSVGNEAEKQGMKVFSIDWTAYDNIDLVSIKNCSIKLSTMFE